MLFIKLIFFCFVYLLHCPDIPDGHTLVFMQYLTPLVVRVFSLFLITPEVGSSNLSRNISRLAQDYTVPHTRTQYVLIFNNFPF